MGSCCCKKTSGEIPGYTEKLNPNSEVQPNHAENITAEERERRRDAQAKAAEGRSKDFKQGGGGEHLKAKQKALEDAERKNAEKGGGLNLKWSVG